MTARATVLCSALMALALAAPAVAQDAEESNFSGIFQLDVTNAYFFRGIKQEREGIILQPWTELYYSLYSSEEGFLRDVTIGAGLWTSWHSKLTLHSEDPAWLYEADYYPLLSLGFAGGVSLTTVYYFYTSPNGAFTTAQELNLKLAWDDSEAFGAWSMKPWVNLAIETENTAFGPDTGFGLQLGVAPTLYSSENENCQLSLTLPIEAGYSLGSYYEYERFDAATGTVFKGIGENAFGYASVGLLASLPLGGIPESLGAWTLNVGAKYLFFGDTLDRANHGRGSYPVGTLSLAVEF